MAFPVYVLLPAGCNWVPIAGTSAQAPAAVKWYLRQLMPDAVSQTAVLVAGDEHERQLRIAEVASRARQLGGVAIDGHTQLLIEPVEHAAAR